MEEMGNATKSVHIADPGKQARSQSGIPIVPVFDGYRALAIAGVVLLHMSILSGVVATSDSGILAQIVWGTVGHAVDILFVISGFVVFLPTVARKGRSGTLSSYAIRRAARILPAYWMVLLISYLLILLTTVSPDVDTPPLRDLGLHFVGLQVPALTFLSDITPGLGVNPPLWTLSAEIIFYVVLPFIAATYFRHPLAGLVVAAFITLAWNWSFENLNLVDSWVDLGISNLEIFRQSLISTLQFPSWAFSFGLGMTGAWAYVKWRVIAETEAGKSTMRWVLAFALTGFAFFAYLAGGFAGSAEVALVAQYSRFSPEISIGYSGFLALSMVAIALGPTRFRWPFANRPMRWLGDISYGIYLSHMLFTFYFASYFSLPDDGSLGAFLICTLAIVPLSVLYGYTSARFLEQPLRRWARKFGRRQHN